MVRRVANKSATSWQQVVVTEFAKGRDITGTTDNNSLENWYGFAIQGRYGVTGVMDFRLICLCTVFCLATYFDQFVSIVQRT